MQAEQPKTLGMYTSCRQAAERLWGRGPYRICAAKFSMLCVLPEPLLALMPVLRVAVAPGGGGGIKGAEQRHLWTPCGSTE